MAIGDTTISGAFTFTSTDIAAAETVIENILSDTMSSANIFSIPSANSEEFFLGVTELQA